MKYNPALSFLPTVYALQRSGRSNPHTLAVMATEVFFRSSLQHLFEYLAWIILSFVWPQRAEKLSVGIAQVQVSHWIRLGFISSSRLSLRTLALFTDPEANYDVSQAFLNSFGYQRTFSLHQIVRVYRGEVRSYHLRVLTECYRFIVGQQRRPIPGGRCHSRGPLPFIHGVGNGL